MGWRAGKIRSTLSAVDFNSMKDKAKGLLGQHDAKVDQGIDKAAEAAKQRFAGQEERIDGLAQKAKDHDFSGDQQAPDQEQQAPPPPADRPAE